MKLLFLVFLLSSSVFEINTQLIRVDFKCDQCTTRTDCKNNLCISNIEGQKIQICKPDDECFPNHKDYFGIQCKSGLCAISQIFEDCEESDKCQEMAIKAECQDGITTVMFGQIQVSTTNSDQCFFDRASINITKCDKKLFGKNCSCCYSMSSTNINFQANGGICIPMDEKITNFKPLVSHRSLNNGTNNQMNNNGTNNGIKQVEEDSQVAEEDENLINHNP